MMSMDELSPTALHSRGSQNALPRGCPVHCYGLPETMSPYCPPIEYIVSGQSRDNVSILPGAVRRHCTRTAPQSMTTNHGLPWAWGAVRVQPTTMYQGSPNTLLGITRDNARVAHFDCPDCVDYLHTLKSNN